MILKNSFSVAVQTFMFLISNRNNGKIAKRHLNDLGILLSKIDPNLAEIANNSMPKDLIPPSSVESVSLWKKRKKDNGVETIDIPIPKKKHVSGNERSPFTEEDLSYKEEKALDALAVFVEECGGA